MPTERPSRLSRISGTQLTALVPAALIAKASTASVTVFNPTPGGGTSNVTFFPITDPTSSISFLRSENPDPKDNGPTTLVTGDFNGDGKLDMAMVNCTNSPPSSCGEGITGSVSILLGNGDGTFSLGQTLTVGVFPTSISVGDFNGDGKLDLAVTNDCGSNLSCTSPGTVSILLGNGDGTFTLGTAVTVGFEPRSLGVADFNGDGKLDLAVVNCAMSSLECGAFGGSLSILLGNGDGTFTPKSSITLGIGASEAQSVAVGDFNGDGKLDLAVANDGGISPPGAVSIFLGNGDGTFTSGPSPSVGAHPDSVVVGDFNGDGKLDLVVGGNLDNQIFVLLGNGDGTFSTASMQPAPGGTSGLAVGDLNGDGKLDLAAYVGLSTISIFFGNGDGTFTAGPNQSVDNAPFGIGAFVAVGDFNDDGRLDLVTPLTVLLQGAVVSLSPGSLDFGNQQVGTTSASQFVTLTNTGSAGLSISSITASGNFAQTNTCSSSVNAGFNCTITITFTPTAPGARSGAVTITDNANPNPQTVNLTGNGTDFAISVSPASQTIPSGHDAVFTLTLTSMGGFDSNVQVTCAGGPPNSTCTIAPSLVNVNGSSTATATIELLPPKNVDHGTFTLVFTATPTGGGVSHSATASLTVK